jgi:dephospho-CoA kinase
MRILALSGRCAAGKSTIASFIKECCSSAQIITTGDVVRRMLLQSGIERTHENVQAFNQELVTKYGDAYISFIFEFFDKNAPFIIIDSFRRPVDVQVVENAYGSVAILGVYADEDVRYTRLKSRGRSGDPITATGFKQLSELEDNWGIDEVVQKAQLSICNMGTLDNLKIDVVQKVTDLLN